MRTAGIVCECNPFHGGHGHLMEQARLAGCECIVCAMSGEFVQRGEPAVMDPYRRAHLLLLGGADLVVELPFPYSASSAEFFARGGVEILSRMGVDELWFGSESGDLGGLDQMSRAMDDPAFLEAYTAAARGNRGTAEAFFDSLRRVMPTADTCLSNDILALSYLRALRRLSSPMTPHTVRREGSRYTDEALPREAAFPSATALRRSWKEGGYRSILSYLPEGAEEILAAAEAAGEAPADLQGIEQQILGQLRILPPWAMGGVAEWEEGLARHMNRAARESTDLEGFLRRCVGKKYPLSRIKRNILYRLCFVTDEALRRPIPFVRLLGANQKGRAYLARMRKGGALPVVTRRTELPETHEAAQAEEMLRISHDLYTLTLPKRQKSTDLWERMPVILP